MRTLTRRELLGAAGAMALANAAPLGMPVGCQLYPVRDLVTKDFEGALKEVASIGYRTIELCSPPGYEKSGFGTLVGRKAADVRKSIEAAGLRCESCHYQFRELKENLAERIAYAKEIGIKQMIVASFGIKPDAPMADWMKAADELNKVGEAARKSGMVVGFHNHHGEFKEIDGVLIYDALLKRLDPALVKMQFQVAVISAGFEAVPYFTKYPGRFISLHLADWSSAEKKSVPVGAGVVDWKKLFAAAKKGGVKNYFVEMNLDAMRPSFTYLSGLKA